MAKILWFLKSDFERNEIPVKSPQLLQTTAFLYVAVAHNKPKTWKMAIKPKDLKFEEAALRKRLEFVKSIKAALKQEDSITTQTVEAYTSIIDGTCLRHEVCIYFCTCHFAIQFWSVFWLFFLSLCAVEIIKEVAQKVHRAVKTGVVSFFLQTDDANVSHFPRPPPPSPSLLLQLIILNKIPLSYNIYRMIYMILNHGNMPQQSNKESSKQAKMQRQQLHQLFLLR